MLALAAARLGFKTHIFAPSPDEPAFDVCAARTIAPYDDPDALDAFARAVDVVTYEFENVPAATAEFLDARTPVRPNPRVLALTQDRLVEKEFVQRARHRDRRLCGCVRRGRAGSRRRQARATFDPQDAPLRL